MLEKIEAIGRTAAHAAQLIFDRTATVDPWLLALGALLYLVAQTVRPRGWHTILRAAFPEATDLRPRDVIRAYLAGAGVNAIVPARGGDVVKLALLRRRIAGARVRCGQGSRPCAVEARADVFGGRRRPAGRLQGLRILSGDRRRAFRREPGHDPGALRLERNGCSRLVLLEWHPE